MLRALFRTICILLLVTIIIDVTNTKCFDKSLTFKYSKQLGALQWRQTVSDRESILSKFAQMNRRDKTDAGSTGNYRDICLRVKQDLHTAYIWIVLLIRNTCLFVQQLRGSLAKLHPDKITNSRVRSPSHQLLRNEHIVYE